METEKATSKDNPTQADTVNRADIQLENIAISEYLDISYGIDMKELIQEWIMATLLLYSYHQHLEQKFIYVHVLALMHGEKRQTNLGRSCCMRQRSQMK